MRARVGSRVTVMDRVGARVTVMDRVWARVTVMDRVEGCSCTGLLTGVYTVQCTCMCIQVHIQCTPGPCIVWYMSQVILYGRGKMCIYMHMHMHTHTHMHMSQVILGEKNHFDQHRARAMSYVEVHTLGRDTLLSVLASFPESSNKVHMYIYMYMYM